MAGSSPVTRRTDIFEAAELIGSEMAGVTLRAFEVDKRKRWLVERGIAIISEANRHLPDAMKARHPGIPWSKVSGIGNVLHYEYERVAYDVLWHVVRHDLPILEKACRDELIREQVPPPQAPSCSPLGITVALDSVRRRPLSFVRMPEFTARSRCRGTDARAGRRPGLISSAGCRRCRARRR
jgi:uncharacterized protein with HEPN domain